MPEKIIGETARSWLIGFPSRPLKVPKVGGDVRHAAQTGSGRTAVYMTQDAVDAAAFLHDHKYRIVKAVGMCTDVAIMRQVASLVGYKAEE